MAEPTVGDKDQAGAVASPLKGKRTNATKPGEADPQAASKPDEAAAQAVSGGPQADGASTSDSAAHAPASQGAYPVGFIRQYEIVDRVKAYDPNANEDLLNRAYVFAMKAHGGQTRKSGDPYFTHPLAVAAILTELKTDPATVATALLHDVVEDTDVSVDDIKRLFGAEIAKLVDGVTKLSQIELKPQANRQAENFRKLVVAMADDVRVLLVKLADRLHNMRTLDHIPDPDKRQRIALETMEIYAPLAGRIGVQKFREELEDLSFRELSPQAFKSISARLEELQRTAVAGVIELAQMLRKRLADAGVKADVYSREKRPYSIWRKMAAKNVSFDELADIYAFRVITEKDEDCYRALGVIHTGWRMIPSEFDDYISAPKPNNYRSIHTAVIGPPRADGGRQRIEIQIRTRAMHETAERGVAAHWQYKDSGNGGLSIELNTPSQYDPYETPRRLVEMFQYGEDPDEALRYAKLELFQDQVFCFTPKGRIIALPKGSTAIDFAYAVHTDVGDSCIGAKINGAPRPLRTALKNGDVVQILRSENAPPPAEWETLAMTGRARSAIRRRIKKMQFAEQVALGRSIAEGVFSGAHLEFSAKAVRAGLARLGEKNVEEVLAKVGRGDLSVNQLIEAVYPGASHESESEIRAPGARPFKPRVAIEGLTPGVSVKMAPCCTPLPGERIVGIREDDGSISVHTIDCATLAREDPPQSRWLDLSWRKDQTSFRAIAQIIVTVRNEVGVLSDVAGVIARYGVSIVNIKMRNRSQDFVELIIDAEVKDARQMEQMLAGLRASTAVLSAERNEVGDQ
ncbi:MAG: RelA/SpoT family protein [Alphaproteobacteria bacterium]|nr:RelA/SpoT family protein [Alphaproteobacteria bacterium]